MADTVGEMTERLLVDAGIIPGMQVLDVGCGSGEVSILLAKRVGAAGQVLGIDQDQQSLIVARQRTAQLANVTFAQADLRALSPGLGPFDAIVGRRVLMYLPDPVDTLRRLAASLRPGGMVVFQEHDSTMAPWCHGRLQPLPLHEQVQGWIRQTLKREGANIHMGFDLPIVLAQAGLTVENVRAEAIIQTPQMSYPVAAIIRAMLPRIIQQAVANEKEVNIATLEQRLNDERVSANSIYLSEMVFGAWARKPWVNLTATGPMHVR